MPALETRPPPDQVLVDIANYVGGYDIDGAEPYRMARLCLMDALGCGLAALQHPECVKLMGPAVPGMACRHGARVPGTRLELDPVSAAFSTATAIRWLDFNDSFGAADGGHPSDNIGAILAVADYLSRSRVAAGGQPILMREVLTALIKSYEIQGVLQLENSLIALGFDYITFPRVAAAAVATQMLGGCREDIVNAVSNAFADGATPRIYRQGNNTGSRKSWAGGDAASRGVRHALMAMRGEMGYPSVLTAPRFGFYEALFRGQPFRFQRPYGHYIVENVTFKFVPAGNLGQSAVECAFRLHSLVKDRISDIESILIKSQRRMMGTMDKTGPLTNPADRDHSVQYIVAVGLIHGRLEAESFEDGFAADPRIDQLRDKMTVVEDPQYTRDYTDPAKRSKANAVRVRFKDGSSTPLVEVEYTMGHPRRRAECLPMMEAKFARHLAGRLPARQQEAILRLFADQETLEATPVNDFMDLVVI